MGSQTLDIFRQGVWASLTGGWFYDPHQNVFCNAVHLYIWLFFLCTPFFSYLYFPKTYATWGAYSIATACMMAVLKVINMALHMLYDRSQAMSETGSKKAIRDSESCGIEMQVLGLENALRTSLKGQTCECSAGDSVASFDLEANNASTIDFKVDVHRKNSSASIESVLDKLAQACGDYIVEQNIDNKKCDNQNVVNVQSGEDKSKENRISSGNESEGAMATTSSEQTSNTSRSFKNRDGTKPKLKTKLNRQSSLDIAEIPNAYSLHSYIGHDDPHTLNFHLAKLQRHNSSDSAEDNPNRSISSNSVHEQHVKMPKTGSRLYSEGVHAKSDLGIENLEQDGNKFSMEPCKHMRKDSNGTMSVLQLPMEASSNNARKRRYSNAGSKVVHIPPNTVRRIKSAALEISCLQPSVSNLSAHPNSAETISGRQIKNPQSAILPPPSKFLVRNPHLNLCPKMDNHSGLTAAAIDPVYPIAEQVDEKNILSDDFRDHGLFDKKIHNLNNLNLKRCSITESESDLDRPRTRSTDSDADINGSSSPLLNRVTTSDKNDNRDRKATSSTSNLGRVNNNNECLIRSRTKGGDSGCPSSDCEQASASSKDMLLAGTSKCNSKANSSANIIKNFSRDEKSIKNDAIPSTSQKDSKSLGAIPKTSRRSEEIYAQCDELQSVIQKSPSTTSSEDSLKGYIFEKFPTEIYSNYRDQWLIIGDTKHNMLPITYVASEAALNTHPRRALMDGNFKLTPTLHRSNATKRRKRSEGYSKDENDIARPMETENDDTQVPKSSVALSLTDFVQAQYQEQLSITRPSRGTVLNIRGAEFDESAYSDYWRSLSTEKQIPPKRCYKYRLKWFGSKELKIKMDRLQLLALFDRDLNWFHVILSVLLSVTVCFLGSIILNLGIYKDVSAFLFCLVIAGSQYSLLKSVQPDAASPVHGFNKTVAYSRPIYFCLFCGLLLLSRYISNELKTNEVWKRPHTVSMFGISFMPETMFESATYWISIVLLLFPILFSLGLFPQFNTFCMYVLEQIDMHIFGGSAVCSLTAAILCVIKSIIAVCILYGPIYGGLAEMKGTQHISFSIFCAMLVSLSYHYSRCATDFSHIWSLIKSSLFNYADDDEDDIDKSNSKIYMLDEKADDALKKGKPEPSNDENQPDKSTAGDSAQSADTEQPDPLPKKLQNTVNWRLKNDLVVCGVIGIFILALHSTTVFTVLQPDLNGVLFSIACVLGFCLHYLIPQMRKHLPWLCFARPILRQREFGRFEVSEPSRIMSFEQIYVYLGFLEKNVLYPLIFISAITADSQKIVAKYGLPLGSTLVSVSALKAVRSSYADTANQYLVIAFCVLLFKFDFSFASETFILNYFVVSTIYRKLCEFLLKMQFVVTYIAPFQITWGSSFHAFAQPFSVPHSAMLFVQTALSAILSTPLNPFLGSAIFLASYARPIKFWERDYNTRRIDHSNTRLSSQLERDLGADDNNLNSIFYEHLTRSLQHSLCGDLMLGRWGNVNQGDCFVLASDYLNCLVHIIELGNGLCTFQMRGLEFRGTYCQQREVEAISEEIADNDGCCCCSPGHMPSMLSANAMFSTRWLAWQVVAAQYVLEGYSISENLATATLQLFEFRKVLTTYYIKSIIYYVTQSPKLNEWLAPGPIQEALENTLNRQFVDLDPIFNYNLDEDFDFRALGITRGSFCFVYLNWIQFCYSKRVAERNTSNTSESGCNGEKPSQSRPMQSSQNSTDKVNENEAKKDECMENDCPNADSANNENIISKDSQLVSLCLALGLLARRSLATASHGSLSGVEFFLHGLHALFKGDFRITSPRDEWVFADMELLHGVVAPAVKMGLKLHQDHFSSPDEYLDPAVLYDAIRSHTKELVISHEADPVWRNAVLRGAPNLLALRHVMEDGSDEYRIIRLTKRFLSFRVIKLNRECVRGLWAGQQQELIYLRNRNPERGSIQNAKQALRNIINSSCDQPIGYPIYVSSLTTSYAETNEQLRELIGGSITLDSIQTQLLNYWNRIKRRCQEGCSSGSGVIDCDNTNELSANYFLPSSAGNATTLTCGSQSLPSSSIRGSLASMNKPSNSALLVGFLNREREQDRENVRERLGKKTLSLRGTDRSEREKASMSTAMSPNNNESSPKDTLETLRKQISNPEAFAVNLTSNSSEQLSEHDIKSSIDFRQENILLTEISKSADQMLVEINKKVIIVDGMEIYDCLDLGRRIDVIWPNEKMRLNGGRSSWKDWSPKEGMVGFVVHYWQPNHPDQRFRSNVNRTLYLVAIGDRFVPVGERGIKEYKQIGLDFAQVKAVLPLNDTDIEKDSFFNISKSASIYDLKEADVVVDTAAADFHEDNKKDSENE